MRDHAEPDEHMDTRAAWDRLKEVEIFACGVKLAGVVILLVFLLIVRACAGGAP